MFGKRTEVIKMSDQQEEYVNTPLYRHCKKCGKVHNANRNPQSEFYIDICEVCEYE